MQLGFSFSLLLASLILSLSSSVSAAPVQSRNPGFITLPLKRLQPQQRSDLHPTVLLQQHINRSHRRHARMTGRAEPTADELAKKIRKRYNRNGTKPKGSKRHFPHFEDIFGGGNAGNGNGNAADPDCQDGNGNGVLGQGQGGKGGKGGKGNQGGNQGGGVVSGGAGGNSTVGVGADVGSGFSEVALAAQNAGGLTAAGKPTADNSLGLDIEANDVGYIATVQVGTPPQDFKILMDSGSADFWIGAENCQSEAGGGCGTHTFLGPKGSSSFVDTNKPFQVSYGTGNVAGDIITDNVNLAGLALDKHTFGVATSESVDFSDNSVPFDGLMGLAQSGLSEQQVPTPVESLAKAGLIAGTITSFKISRLADQKNDGEITFGGLDTTKFDANTLTTFANVNKQGFWEGAVDSFTIDGQDLGLQGRTAILDTGTTLIVAPEADALAVHQAIPGAASDGQGGFTIPCTTTSQFAISFGGKAFNVNPQDLLFAPVDPNNLQGDCISGISAGNVGGANEWLVGDVFLKNAYFSVDTDKNQISLAELV